MVEENLSKPSNPNGLKLTQFGTIRINWQTIWTDTKENVEKR